MPDSTGTTERRIRLSVSSPRPQLAGLGRAISELEKMRGVLTDINAITQRSSLLSFLGQTQARIAAVAQSAREARGAIASLAREPIAPVAAPPVIRTPANPGRPSVNGGGRWLARGLDGWTPAGFARNSLTAGAWSAAVAVPYSAAQFGRYSFKRMEEIGLNEARLSQVFRGIGGSARDLTKDVLSLASAEGRASDEAMQSAVAWSRLGLSRRQVAEAVRTSLMAANVAEISAAEATQHLTSVMAAYDLQVSDLSGVLGVLNQLSNTYRVTNRELLEGLSRVSGVAKQAGLGLAELSAMITIAVQQTGQSGANIGNAIKTVLTRLNRPDIQKFFSERYQVDVSGSADDLRKVWEIYSRVNDEQKRDILLKVGSATQANRLAAILNTYTQSVMAAADALQHLSSATAENVLITNTAASARQRLISSWDRMVASPWANRTAASGFNVGAGLIAGVTNALPSAPENFNFRFFNPNASSMTGVSMALARGAAGWLTPRMSDALGLVNRITGGSLDYSMWKRLGFSENAESVTDKFQIAMNQIAVHSKAAEAAGLRSEHFGILAKNWGTMAPEARQLAIDSIAGRIPASALASLQSGDASGLAKQAERERAISAAERALAEKKTKEQIEAETQNVTNAKTTKDRLEAEVRLHELNRDLAGLWRDQEQTLAAQVTKAEQLVNVMGLQRGLAADITEHFKSIGLPKSVENLLTLSAQISATQSLIRPGMDPDVEAKLEEKTRELKAQLAYSESPSGRAFSSLTRNAGIATSMARAEISTSGVGLSQGEKLLSQRDFISSQMRQYQNVNAMGQNDLLRAQTLLNAAMETEMSISKRALEVQQEKKQVMIEVNREFQKSLITAGPGDILRKMAANQLYKSGGVNAGSFFAMGSESRGDIYTMMGGERMAQLNSEQRAIRGRSLGVNGLQSRAGEIESRSLEFGTAYAVSIAQVSSASELASRAVSGLAASASAAAIAIGRMTAAVAALPSGRTPTAPSATPPAQAPWTGTVEAMEARGYSNATFKSDHGEYRYGLPANAHEWSNGVVMQAPQNYGPEPPGLPGLKQYTGFQ